MIALGGSGKPRHKLAMTLELATPNPDLSRRLRLNTLIRLRWLAVTGQAAAVLVVAYGMGFAMPVSLCMALIALSAWLNLFLTFRFPAAYRLEPLEALGVLTFDAAQLAGLLYLTGGLTNPFALLLAVPVTISAASLPRRLTFLLGAGVVTAASLLALFHQPMPWSATSDLSIPRLYIAGMWLAIVSSTIFTAVYAWRVADEARKLAGALAATELVLQHEQHLSALDGLAAAAAHELGTPLATIHLIAREMEKSYGNDPQLGDDAKLLASQSQRCREILKRLTSLPSEDHIARLPFLSMIEEISAPHRDFGVTIKRVDEIREGPEPVARRNPGMLYGLGNLLENAVDFARTEVNLHVAWTADRVSLYILDDGPGIAPEILERIGEPYTSSRAGKSDTGGGLGLGVFIAKTLLERSGASVTFANSRLAGKGARIEIVWPRSAFAYSGANVQSGLSDDWTV